MIRKAVVAGQFYPGSKNSLLKEVERLVDKKQGCGKVDAMGVFSPHAGYIYSGPVAGKVFSAIKPKSTYVIMGPSHTGLGAPFAISPSDLWRTPLGEVKTDRALADEILRNSKYVTYDELPHAHEHSIEVQLPFLQFIQKGFKFVPMVISYGTIDVYREVGRSLAKSLKVLNMEKDVTIIASSDMTHYEPQESAKRKDSIAIKAMLELNEEELTREVSEFDISMCGYAPAIVMLTAVKELGAKSASLLKYMTSGDITGDYSSVVGYAGIVIT